MVVRSAHHSPVSFFLLCGCAVYLSVPLPALLSGQLSGCAAALCAVRSTAVCLAVHLSACQFYVSLSLFTCECFGLLPHGLVQSSPQAVAVMFSCSNYVSLHLLYLTTSFYFAAMLVPGRLSVHFGPSHMCQRQESHHYKAR